MLGLFTRDEKLHFGQVQFPEFIYTRKTYLREIANVVDFYHTRVFAVKSNHFLVNLLNTLSVPLQYEIERFVSVAQTKAPYIASALQMTSEINPGKIFKGDFFGEGSSELIIFDDDYFNPGLAEKEWKRINAVKVLLHPKSDLGLLLANGRLSSTGSGLSVISINIALLAVQFRGFLLDQQQKNMVDPDAGHLAINHFVHMYVLPNMLYSQIDITLMNRTMNLFYGSPMGEAYYKHPFKVTQYNHRVDNALKYAISSTRHTSNRFSKTLFNIPAIHKDSMLDALRLPDFAPTRQIYWAMVLSRLDYMAFLIDLSREHGIDSNRDSINAIQRILYRFEDEKIFDKVLPRDMLFDVKETVKAILST